MKETSNTVDNLKNLERFYSYRQFSHENNICVLKTYVIGDIFQLKTQNCARCHSIPERSYQCRVAYLPP